MSENKNCFNPCVIETELAVIIILLLVFLLKDCDYSFYNNCKKNKNKNEDSNKSNNSNKPNCAW